MIGWSSTFTTLVLICSCTYGALSEADDQDVDVCAEVPGEAQKDDRVNLMQSLRVKVERVAVEEADDQIGNISFPISPQLLAAADEAEAWLFQVHNASNTPNPSLSLTEIGGSVRKLARGSTGLDLMLIVAAGIVFLFVCVSTTTYTAERRRNDGVHPRSEGIHQRSQIPPAVGQKADVQYRRSPQYMGTAPTTATTVSAPPVSTLQASRSRFEPTPPPPSSTQPAPQSEASPEAVSHLQAFSYPQAAHAAAPAWQSGSAVAVNDPSMTTPYPSLMSAAVMPDQPTPPSMADISDMPSPICPSLVLPVCESRFAIPMSEIHGVAGREGTLNIGGGLSGNALLRAYVRNDATGRCVEIATPEPGAVVRASIGLSKTGSLERPGVNVNNLLDIRGLRGAYYGLMEICSTGPCIVTRQGQQLMVIDGDPEELKLWITSASDKQLASGRCCKEPFGGVDHVDIRVQPGMDTVLALACILAVLLFTPN